MIDLPTCHETEQQVLGAMLRSPQALDYGLGNLGADQFYQPAHRHIFQAMERMFNENTAVDLLTLTEQLKKMGRLDEIGGVAALSYLDGTIATTANLRLHAGIVQKTAARRAMIALGQQLTAAAQDVTQELEELAGTVDRALGSVLQRQDEGLVRIEDKLPELLDEIEAASKREGNLVGVSTGLSSLDARTAGLEEGTLILLAARPSVGKTALGLQIAGYVAQTYPEKGGVAFFSVEMQVKAILTRLLCNWSSIEFNRLRTGKLSDVEWLTLTRMMGGLARLPLYLDQTGGISLLEIRTRARLLARKQPLSLVVVDYLQLVTSPHSREREQEVSAVSRGLKALAKELNIPVLALVQMNRAIETRASKMPQLSDLRESGSLEQDADMVIFLGEMPNEENQLEVVIGKSRNGPRGAFPLHYERPFFRFADAASPHRQEYVPAAP